MTAKVLGVLTFMLYAMFLISPAAAQKFPVGIVSVLDTTKSVQFGVISSVAADGGRGFQFGGVSNVSGHKFSGFQLGGVSNVTNGMDGGLQLSGILNVSSSMMRVRKGATAMWWPPICPAWMSG